MKEEDNLNSSSYHMMVYLVKWVRVQLSFRGVIIFGRY